MVCLCVSAFNFSTSGPIVTEFGMNVMPLEATPSASFRSS